MKTTVVPAQVTTVEDRVAGNISFRQLLLMIAPVFIDTPLLMLTPPLFKVTLLKCVIGSIIASVFLLLAIRIKGKLVIDWFGIVVRYRRRPTYYLFNKNSDYLRASEVISQKHAAKPVAVKKKREHLHLPHIPIANRAALETVMADPRANFRIKSTKGGLRVYIREVKEEGI